MSTVSLVATPPLGTTHVQQHTYHGGYDEYSLQETGAHQTTVDEYHQSDYGYHGHEGCSAVSIPVFLQPISPMMVMILTALNLDSWDIVMISSQYSFRMVSIYIILSK